MKVHLVLPSGRHQVVVEQAVGVGALDHLNENRRQLTIQCQQALFSICMHSINFSSQIFHFVFVVVFLLLWRMQRQSFERDPRRSRIS